MGAKNFIFVNQNIYINKTYKNLICSNGNKLHTMYLTKSTKDATGTYINEYSVKLTWFGNMDLSPQQSVQITGIIGYDKEKYKDRTGNIQVLDSLTIEVMPSQNYGNNNYASGGYQQGANYSQYQQPQNGNSNYYQQSNNSYGSYNGNNNNDDYGV